MTRIDLLRDLRSHLERYYAGFDWQAMEAVLSVALLSFSKFADSISLLIVGPSRTGKTEAINTLESLPHAYALDNITPQTFTSGKNKGAQSLLLKLEADHKSLLLFKDFTVILSKRPEQRDEILSDLRRIADGHLVKNTGEGVRVEWRGKMSIIGACTPEIERHWSVMHAMGSRFFMVRWPLPDPVEAAERALENSPMLAQIRAKSSDLVGQILQIHGPIPPLAPDQRTWLASIAGQVSSLRAVVIRDPATFKNIIDIQAEGSPSLAYMAGLVAQARAVLYNHVGVEPDDLALASRVLFDSVPSHRQVIWDNLTTEPIPLAELVESTGLSPRQLRYALEDLEGIGLITIDQTFESYTYARRL